jgi:hypothetical protein
MIRTELNLRLPNSPGEAAGVCRALADAAVNILALMLDGTGQLRLVVDNPVHAVGILRALHYQVSEREVLVVQIPNSTGALAPALRLIAAAGVNVDYAYGAGAESGPAAAVVIGVADAMRAAAAAGV